MMEETHRPEKHHSSNDKALVDERVEQARGEGSGGVGKHLRVESGGLGGQDLEKASGYARTRWSLIFLGRGERELRNMKLLRATQEHQRKKPVANAFRARFCYLQATPRPYPTRDPKMYKARYCCFAIPLYGIGIYIILLQFLVISLVAGILSLAAPSVLAIVVPSYLTSILGVLLIIIGALQAIGFFGVFKEKAALFSKYQKVNLALVVITLLYTLAIIVLSATRHSQAVTDCVAQFIEGATNSTGTSSGDASQVSGESLCNIWTWAQLGVCGLLWLLLGMSEIYFCIMESKWSTEQRQDHLKYRSIVSAARESMALNREWDPNSRPGSIDDDTFRRGHTPKESSRLRNEIDRNEDTAAPPGTGNPSGSGSGSGYASPRSGRRGDESAVDFEDPLLHSSPRRKDSEPGIVNRKGGGGYEV